MMTQLQHEQEMKRSDWDDGFIQSHAGVVNERKKFRVCLLFTDRMIEQLINEENQAAFMNVKGDGVVGMGEADLFNRLKRLFFPMINHHVQKRQGLEQTRFNPGFGIPDTTKNVRADTEKPGIDLHDQAGIGILDRMKNNALRGVEHQLVTNILVTTFSLPPSLEV